MAYIPKKHSKYNLLPFCGNQGGEVFCYPQDLLQQINSMLSDNESVTPYGFFSYRSYFSMLDELTKKYKDNNYELYRLLTKFRKQMKDLNSKENWAVARYVGESTRESCGLTKGQCYYWPCSKSSPKYIGVIDNEEFTAHPYPVNSELWEILEDPKGITQVMNDACAAAKISYEYNQERLLLGA